MTPRTVPFGEPPELPDPNPELGAIGTGGLSSGAGERCDLGRWDPSGRPLSPPALTLDLPASVARTWAGH